MSASLKRALAALAADQRPTPDDLEGAVGAALDGEASDAQIGALLMGLRLEGLRGEEIAAAATALRARMLPIEAPADAIDVCGTGGDGHATLNISTAVALTLAGCGVTVAKHGNRAMSSRSGAADVLEALGVRLDAPRATLERALREAGIAFLFAQAHHPALKRLAPARRELGFRTVFNLLGPLASPAGVMRQLIGVFDARLIEPMAQAVQLLGDEAAWIVCGEGGLDEIALSGPTQVATVLPEGVRRFEVSPEDFGLPRRPLEALAGGDPTENAAALRRLLEGERGAYRDAVLLNAAAALIIAERVHTLAEGIALAETALDEGRAAGALQTLIEITNAA